VRARRREGRREEHPGKAGERALRRRRRPPRSSARGSRHFPRGKAVVRVSIGTIVARVGTISVSRERGGERKGETKTDRTRLFHQISIQRLSERNKTIQFHFNFDFSRRKFFIRNFSNLPSVFSFCSLIGHEFSGEFNLNIDNTILPIILY